jgi:cell division protein FtsB
MPGPEKGQIKAVRGGRIKFIYKNHEDTWQSACETPLACYRLGESNLIAFVKGNHLLRFVKNALRAALPPAIFLGITWYFAWNAVHGSRGLEAQQAQVAALAKAQAQFTVIDADRAQWETRIADLSGQSIGPDMLDDQARLVLNLAQPGDLVVQLPPAGQSAQSAQNK